MQSFNSYPTSVHKSIKGTLRRIINWNNISRFISNFYVLLILQVASEREKGKMYRDLKHFKWSHTACTLNTICDV